MSYVKLANIPPAPASEQGVDPHSVKEKNTYMRDIYKGYHAHDLKLEDGNKGPEEGIAVNSDAIDPNFEVVGEEDLEVPDKEQPEPAVHNLPLGLVAGEIAQELDGEELKNINPGGAALEAEGTEDVPEDGLGDLVFCACESLGRLHCTELTMMLLSYRQIYTGYSLRTSSLCGSSLPKC